MFASQRTQWAFLSALLYDISKNDLYKNTATITVVTAAIEEVANPVFWFLSQPDKPMLDISENIPKAIDNELVSLPNLSDSKSVDSWRALAKAMDEPAQIMKQQAAKAEQKTIQFAILLEGAMPRIAARNVAEKPPRKAESKISCSVITIICSTLKTSSLFSILRCHITLS